MPEAPISKEGHAKLEAPPLKKPLIVENIDPSDILLRTPLFSNMVKEHTARYEYIHSFAKDKLPELVDKEINILDIASARGYGSAILKNEFPKATVVGVEYGDNYSLKAKQKYSPNGEGPNFLKADARRLPIKDSSMNIAAAFEIVEHLPKKDQPEFLKEIVRVLKPGGYCFFSIPHRYSFEKNKKNETVRVPIGGNPYHLYEPLPNEVDQYIADSGLEVVGRFGQIMVSEKTANAVVKINRVLPVWSVFAWTPKRDVSVVNVPEGKVGVTNIYVLKKPAFHEVT
jgi:ubiquinone/menaquinone biosynthesis C-methylase UbiE